MSEARLECKGCHREEKLTIAQSLQYLAHGWPLCCGETMEIHVGPRLDGKVA
jgi:hypothetical protein